ncbi:MAG: ATP-binding protein, partial [Amphiplicatus sp.]
MFQYAQPDAASILVIDDEPQIVAAVSDLLEDHFRVVPETSAEAALAILKQDPSITTILCDQRMPRMTGDRFFTEAKNISIATRVMITGYADLQVVVRAVNEGRIFAYVTKPWDADNLITTVRKASEYFSINRALWRERSLLSDLMRSTSDGVFFKDREGRFLRLNETEARFLGLSNIHEAVGKTVHDLLPPALAEEIDAAERDLVATGKPVFDHVRQIVLKGDKKIYSVNMTAVRDPGDGIAGIVGISRDVTEEKNAQTMKDAFVSTVSHELRTPLTSILGSLALLRGGVAGELPGRVGEFIEISCQNCSRLLRLVGDILDIEKLEKGELRIAPAPIELGEILREGAAANRDYGQADNVVIELAEPVPAVLVNADRDRLLQVLANLLSNAVKFSPPGARVRLRAKLVGDHVRVSIIDRGAGVQPEFRHRLFERFSRADCSDTRKTGGAGLGLAISRSIIDLHGGRLGYRTHVNFGSAF